MMVEEEVLAWELDEFVRTASLILYYVVKTRQSWSVIPFAGILTEDPGFLFGPFVSRKQAEEALSGLLIVEAVMEG